MYKIFLVFLTLIIVSCNGGCGGSGSTEVNEGFVPSRANKSIGQNVDLDAHIESRGKILGNACAIVPKKIIADALGIKVQDIYLRNSTPRDANPTHSSCFFKWDDNDLPNAGILLQMMRNPNEDEFPGYVNKFIEAFRIKGESGIDEQPIYYQRFEGFGDDGSYSLEGGKYFWRLGDKIIFAIAFNTLHSYEDQYRIATTLAEVMTENYLK